MAENENPDRTDEPQNALQPTPETGTAPGSALEKTDKPAPPPPPHPLDAKWRISIEQETYGPYSGHQIKDFVAEGRVTANTRVLRDGRHAWSTAGRDDVLGPLFEKDGETVPKAQGGDKSTVVQVNNLPPPAPAYIGEEFGPKSPGIALLLSLLITGVGQMYNGQVAKGILMLLACIVLWFFYLGWVIWIWSMIDAYQVAKDVNMRYQYQLRRQRNAR